METFSAPRPCWHTVAAGAATAAVRRGHASRLHNRGGGVTRCHFFCQHSACDGVVHTLELYSYIWPLCAGTLGFCEPAVSSILVVDRVDGYTLFLFARQADYCSVFIVVVCSCAGVHVFMVDCGAIATTAYTRSGSYFGMVLEWLTTTNDFLRSVTSLHISYFVCIIPAMCVLSRCWWCTV